MLREQQQREQVDCDAGAGEAEGAPDDQLHDVARLPHGEVQAGS